MKKAIALALIITMMMCCACAESIELPLGNTGFSYSVPEGFNPYELNDTQRALGMTAYLSDGETVLAIYLEKNEELTLDEVLARYVKDGAVSSGQYENAYCGLPAVWCLFEQEQNGVSYDIVFMLVLKDSTLITFAVMTAGDITPSDTEAYLALMH